MRYVTFLALGTLIVACGKKSSSGDSPPAVQETAGNQEEKNPESTDPKPDKPEETKKEEPVVETKATPTPTAVAVAATPTPTPNPVPVNYLAAIRTSEYTSTDPFNCGYRVMVSQTSRSISISVRSLRGTGSCVSEGKNLGAYFCKTDANICTGRGSFKSLSICDNGNIRTDSETLYVGKFNPVSTSCKIIPIN